MTRADVAEQEVLRVRRTAEAAAGPTALTGEAGDLTGLRVPRPVEVGAEVGTQVGPGTVIAVGVRRTSRSSLGRLTLPAAFLGLIRARNSASQT